MSETPEAAPPNINPADIRISAMNLLARREHSQWELLQKLKRRFPDATELAVSEVQRLSDENLQSDERFAQDYVRARSGRGYGLMRVRQGMRERGLSDLQIAQALESANVDWQALADAVFHKKFGQQPAADVKDTARRARFMQYRGFASAEYQKLL